LSIDQCQLSSQPKNPLNHIQKQADEAKHKAVPLFRLFVAGL